MGKPLKNALKLLLGALAILLVLFGRMVYSLRPYRYVSSDYGFRDFEMSGKGNTLEMVERHFEAYKAKTGKTDLRLCLVDERSWWDVFSLGNRRWTFCHLDPPLEDAGKRD